LSPCLKEELILIVYGGILFSIHHSLSMKFEVKFKKMPSLVNNLQKNNLLARLTLFQK